jgi:hypothetical protein
MAVKVAQEHNVWGIGLSKLDLFKKRVNRLHNRSGRALSRDGMDVDNSNQNRRWKAKDRACKVSPEDLKPLTVKGGSPHAEVGPQRTANK